MVLGMLPTTALASFDAQEATLVDEAETGTITITIDIFDVDNNVQGLFLCSDGLTNMVTEEQIEKVLNNKSSIEEQVEKLIKKSNMRGGTDNISIAYLKKESGDL